MKATAKTVAAMTAAVLMGAGTAWAVPVVSNVNMQQTPNTRQVQITYDLAEENAIVTISIETNGVAIPDSAVTRLSGDVCKVVGVGNDKSITWNAGADWPENVTDSAKARVTAWSVDAPPQVMVIDLSKGTAASEEDPYPCYYYTSLDALPGGGLSNTVYKTSHLVMRKISVASMFPYGLFNMGASKVAMTLTKDFYVGVYALTQSQWLKMKSGPSGGFNFSSDGTYPAEKVSYWDLRENGSTDDPAVDWPSNDSVTETSFIGLLRKRTGLIGFDLPTEAQWEYACRAGTTGSYNVDGVSALNLGWYQNNANSTTHEVGLKTPSSWGFYDMHGNVWEWCLVHCKPIIVV